VADAVASGNTTARRIAGAEVVYLLRESPEQRDTE
jgi:hypothetical protein